MDMIEFDNAIMKYQVNNPGYQSLHYNIKKWKTQGTFDIIHDISENVTLCHTTYVLVVVLL